MTTGREHMTTLTEVKPEGSRRVRREAVVVLSVGLLLTGLAAAVFLLTPRKQES